MSRIGDAHLEDLKALRALYLRELPAKVRAVAHAGDAAAATWDSSRFEIVYHLAHRLAGSAAIYGFAAVSRAASSLEAFASAAMAGELQPAVDRRSELETLVAALSRAAAEIETGGPARRRSRAR